MISRLLLLLLALHISLFAATPTLSATQVSKLTVSTDPYDGFGRSVAVSGNTLAIGGNGAVYIYEFNTSTKLYEQVAKLTSSNPMGYGFGRSIAINGNTVVVGDFTDNTLAYDNGAVYVFTKPTTGWISKTEDAKLMTSDAAKNDRLGMSVAISGDTIVAGADCDTHSGMSCAGSAYVFVKPSSTGWISKTQDAKLTASNAASADYFGTSVSISGDTIVVGANGHDDGTTSYAGAAYVFVKPSSTGWISKTQDAELLSSNTSYNLGRSVSISGDTVVVGAYNTIYLFTKPSTAWDTKYEDAQLTPSDTANMFAYNVSISGDTVITAANFSYDQIQTSASAYVFTKPSTGWISKIEDMKINAPDPVDEQWFGISLAIDNDIIVLGDYCDDGATVSGSTYIFKTTQGGSVSLPPILYLLLN